MIAPQPDGHPSPDTVAGPDLMKEHVSTWLSSLAILAVSAGLTWGMWPHLGPWALCVGGVVLGLLVAAADVARTPRAPADAEPDAGPAPLPGPADPGNMHIGGVAA